MTKVDWKKDYYNEFVCPKCNDSNLYFAHYVNDNKVSLKCYKCKRKTNNSYNIKSGYLTSRLEAYGLGCPSKDCNARQMVLHQSNQYGKRYYRCTICNATAVESNDITKNNLSRYAQKQLEIKQFIFEEDLWDIRFINSLANNKRSRYAVNFNDIKPNWFKLTSKKYVYHLCKINKPHSTIEKYLTVFKSFSQYLLEKKISRFEDINRGLVLDFIAWGKTTDEIIRTRLRGLKQLFITGNLQYWFQIDPDIILNSDYPKWTVNNPDPIPDIVREQIEKNLHKLPDSIARMWIVCFFAAMRPYELALLKKD